MNTVRVFAPPKRTNEGTNDPEGSQNRATNSHSARGS